MKFRRKQLVRHVKTGGVYRIIHAPTVCRIEAMGEPAYAYSMIAFCNGMAVDVGDAPIWVRPQAEMEDGRFEAVEEPPAPPPPPPERLEDWPPVTGSSKACTKCGMEAREMLFPFCTHKICPVRAWSALRS